MNDPSSDQSELQLHSLVTVLPRMYPGSNKLGGRARITKLHYSDSNPSKVERVDVRYVLGGREKEVELTYVESVEDLNSRQLRADKRSDRKSFGSCEDLKENKLHAPDVHCPMGTVMTKAHKQTKGNKKISKFIGSEKRGPVLATLDQNQKPTKKVKSEELRGCINGPILSKDTDDQWMLIQESNVSSCIPILKEGTLISYYWDDYYGWVQGSITKALHKVITKTRIKWSITVDFNHDGVRSLGFHPKDGRWKVKREKLVQKKLGDAFILPKVRRNLNQASKKSKKNTSRHNKTLIKRKIITDKQGEMISKNDNIEINATDTILFAANKEREKAKLCSVSENKTPDKNLNLIIDGKNETSTPNKIDDSCNLRVNAKAKNVDKVELATTFSPAGLSSLASTSHHLPRNFENALSQCPMPQLVSAGNWASIQSQSSFSGDPSTETNLTHCPRQTESPKIITTKGSSRSQGNLTSNHPLCFRERNNRTQAVASNSFFAQRSSSEHKKPASKRAVLIAPQSTIPFQSKSCGKYVMKSIDPVKHVELLNHEHSKCESDGTSLQITSIKTLYKAKCAEAEKFVNDLKKARTSISDKSKSVIPSSPESSSTLDGESVVKIEPDRLQTFSTILTEIMVKKFVEHMDVEEFTVKLNAYHKTIMENNSNLLVGNKKHFSPLEVKEYLRRLDDDQRIFMDWGCAKMGVIYLI